MLKKLVLAFSANRSGMRQRLVSCSTFLQGSNQRINVNGNYSRMSNKRGLVVMLPWLGATPAGIAKYKAIYSSLDFDVVVHKPSMKDFLWPKAGLRSSMEFLHKLKSIVEEDKSECQIIIHSFSVGCYFYALMIMQMKEHEKLFYLVWESICGQIFDSPVIGTLREMATGVSKMLAPTSPVLSAVCKNLCLWYFAASRQHTVQYYKRGLHAIKFQTPMARSLLMTSEDDPLMIPEAFQETADCWRKRGIVVSSRIWSESAHAQHLRIHPDEYKYLVESFVEKCVHSPRQHPTDSKL